jgi:hypothetical protein
VDPAQLHETAVLVLIGTLFVVMPVVGVYVFLVGRFFGELEEQDPQTWEAIGSPRQGDQMRRRSSTAAFWAFLKPLKEKAGQPRYPAAYWAWLWFRVAAVCTSLLFLTALFVIGLIVYYDL